MYRKGHSMKDETDFLRWNLCIRIGPFESLEEFGEEYKEYQKRTMKLILFLY
ncbi:MAG: hypothetical protein GQ580_00735 [Candidatus Thorarchaeota archaeon]|nr:hypothetical protein [Candidatus Thorarchaeota archaeon]